MSELPLVPLSQLLSLINSRTAGDKNASLPYVGLEHIPSAGSTLLSVGSAADSISTNGVFTSGDILFGKLRPQLHKCVRVTVFGYCSTDILVLRPNAGINPAYAGYIAQSDTVFRAAIRTEEGTKMPRCSWHDLKSVKVLLPNEPVQQKVASILSSLDTAIEKTEALIAKHQQIKAGLMHDLFTRGVLPNGQLRPPRSEAPELYQETAIGWIPKDWKISTLRQCLTDSPTNGIYKPAEQIGEGQLMVGQTAFTEHRSIDFSLCRRGAVDTNEARRYGLAKDDILVTRVFATVEGVGLPTLVPQLIEPAVFESNMMRLRIDTNIVIARLLFEWLQAPIVRSRITGGANASNQCSVNQSILNPLPVVVPIMDEQRQITARVVQADKQREVLVGNLTKLRQQKLGLMQDLLTGKVAVKVDGQTSATSDQALEEKVLARLGERAQAMEVDIDAI